MAIPTNWEQAVRWLPCKNISGEDIPPHAILGLERTPSGEGLVFEDGLLLLNVTKPQGFHESLQRTSLLAVNGPETIKAGSRGRCTKDWPAPVLWGGTDTSVADVSVGPVTDQWYVDEVRGLAAFRTIGYQPDHVIRDGIVWVEPNRSPSPKYAYSGWQYDAFGTIENEYELDALEDIVLSHLTRPTDDIFGPDSNREEITFRKRGVYTGVFSCTLGTTDVNGRTLGVRIYLREPLGSIMIEYPTRFAAERVTAIQQSAYETRGIPHKENLSFPFLIQVGEVPTEMIFKNMYDNTLVSRTCLTLLEYGTDFETEANYRVIHNS